MNQCKTRDTSNISKAHVVGAHDPLLAADFWLSPQENNVHHEFVAFEDEETDNDIRKATNSGRPFGSESFVDMLEFRLNQVLKPRKTGRTKIKKPGSVSNGTSLVSIRKRNILNLFSSFA